MLKLNNYMYSCNVEDRDVTKQNCSNNSLTQTMATRLIIANASCFCLTICYGDGQSRTGGVLGAVLSAAV